MSDKSTKNAGLNLPQVGDTISLGIEGAEHRYEVTWLGFLFEHSVMVTAPRAAGTLVPVYVNDPIAIRYIRDNHIHGFKSQVLVYSRNPYPHIHLEYPKAIADHRVRAAQRVVTELEGSLVVDGQDEAVTILDLSDSGARVQSTRDDLAVDAEVELHLAVEFAGTREDIRLDCVVRNTNLHEEGNQLLMHYGLAFKDMERMERMMLSGFIYEQLSRQRANL
ncbi:MAG: flagellar brake protein [Gammaproteobacteria bacterium]|nr:flagellar brake protein [Gammaproteobacteria bacterium]